jgi:hypothetical protein
LFLLRHHAEQRGFAGTIRADQSDFLALLQRGGCLNEKDLPTILLADIIKANHEGSAFLKGAGAL